MHALRQACMQMDDGGDPELLDLEGNILTLHYMGPAGGVFAVNEIYIAEEEKKSQKNSGAKLEESFWYINFN